MHRKAADGYFFVMLSSVDKYPSLLSVKINTFLNLIFFSLKEARPA